jgi:NAD(P)-dependent dehydrogenase (short-subunit alcohol dehydrogenase family)
MNRNRFQGKAAVVTGAGSGIGLATARFLAEEGAGVILAGLREDRVSAAAAEIRQGGGRAQGLACDVTREPDVERAIQACRDHFGGLDVVVNNAGIMVFKPLLELKLRDWQDILAVDLLGAFSFIQGAFKVMKPGGSIVNVSSIHAVETEPLIAPYAAAKTALLSLTRSASLEAQPLGLRVNAVLPGAVDTPMLWSNPNVKSGAEKILSGDVGRPEDLAAAIVFLASDEARFIQGASLVVDGGRLGRL